MQEPCIKIRISILLSCSFRYFLRKLSKFVENFIKHWISIQGAPQCLFSDLGGEFDSEEVRDMAENLNIDFIKTQGYSP